MPLKFSQNHTLIWSDLLKHVDGTQWFELIFTLYQKNHGYSNYEKSKNRDHVAVRQDVLMDKSVREFIAENAEENLIKVNRVLDEMCHLLQTQSNPTRKLKVAGFPFLKCITKVYSNIFVLNHLFPLKDDSELGQDLFKEQYMQMSKELPMIILPTHRSYMDFLFISYIMFDHELPLPIVAAGDNFKAMGKYLLDFLKGTGAFLVRRNAHNKRDIEANRYYEILRAYVHSILTGGENPLEFFMEGTRTRSGQVLRPKTGLLSMVVDMYIDKVIDDMYILPVSINYQRPIEEQLYVAENTPQLNMNKPKESARNLLAGFNTIMKKKYGKVYVRFIEPFKLSDYFREWKQSIGVMNNFIEGGDRSKILQEFTNSLASKVCLAQAYNNILLPFNLLAYSTMFRTFFDDFNGNQRTNSAHKISFEIIMKDFYTIEQLLINSVPQFVPGWKSHLDIFDDFKIDRDGIIRASDDRQYIEFDNDPVTFYTMQYYSNQVMQILFPVAISLILPDRETDDKKLERFKNIRSLLSKEFLHDELKVNSEFELSSDVIKNDRISPEAKQMVVKHLIYFVKCYLIFLQYFKKYQILDRTQFFRELTETYQDQPSSIISKDMLKNMITLLLDMKICAIIKEDCDDSGTADEKRSKPEEKYTLESMDKLVHLIGQFEQVLNLANDVI